MRLLVGDLPRLPVTIVRELGVRPGDKYVDVLVGDGVRRSVVRVGLTWYRPGLGGLRPTWVCPTCSAPRRWLYITAPDTTVACRECRALRLTYRCRRDRGSKHYEHVIRPLLAARRAR